MALSRDAVIAALEAHKWRYASSMPWVPHFYVLRDKWQGEIPFTDVVQFIYDHGVLMRWGKKDPKPYLDIDIWRYWCMGAPAHETTVINRERIEKSKAVAVGGEGHDELG